MGEPIAGYRFPVTGPNFIRVIVSTPAPASASLVIDLKVEVPKAGASDDLIVLSNGARLRLDVAVRDALPAISTVAALRVQMFCERVVSELMKSIHEQGRANLKKLGYL